MATIPIHFRMLSAQIIVCRDDSDCYFYFYTNQQTYTTDSIKIKIKDQDTGIKEEANPNSYMQYHIKRCPLAYK
ncbi:hypothetical protein [Flavobacterium sp. LHD-85]|uniref:hypothetical protein n=1 Tax=Flavobacterium sp. LHD-85 TaxID=3071410 RepID=UPI0027E02B41|nr:hypothetical protein [Flavobacterium sp. LHD-85]MDQ6532170.1 hypothetical protein [Flavobacterium sp. LHD-85]